MPSPLAKQILDDFWSTWPYELMDRFGIEEKQARGFCGMALKCGSVEKARQVLGNVRESNASAGDIPRYIMRARREQSDG